ncbi:ras guanine nucleotide exchange factor domain-containing protein [Pseudoneurospora amorphoporcata]|uniref:Ras guanine nucleotide exchange factor domain-containing protein n=1 Tax=Pseudoneurospora amorphoporcata TaxID=241081 RepID=A0AAN6SBR8_9PEZI|nr:ras guanine nucleotide exchange factor domain-containing protein [Pseudoneurospora amorphoporcata]
MSEPLAGHHPQSQPPSHSIVEPSQSQLQQDHHPFIRQVRAMFGRTGSGHAEAHDPQQLPELLPKLPNFGPDLDLGDLGLPADLSASKLPLQGHTCTISCGSDTTTPLPRSAGAADPHLLIQDHNQFEPQFPVHQPVLTNCPQTTTSNLDDPTTATSASAAAISSISSTTQPTSATPSLFVSEGTFLLLADDDYPGPGPSSNCRDSFASAILDDPFFCQPVGAPNRPNTHTFDTATTPDSHPSPAPSHVAPSPSQGPTPSPQSESTYSYNRNDPQQPWPPPRKESLRVDSPTPWFDHSRSGRAMASINIAVIGAYGAGKSSFVQRAFRLQRPPELNVSTLRMEIDGTRCLVTLVELDLDGFKDLDPGQSIQWPKQIDGHMVPRMDGALILYDVTNTDSVHDLSPTMTSLANSSLPTILVATKCDTPASIRQLDMNAVAHSFPSCVAHLRISSNIPGGARETLLTMIDAILASRRAGAQERPQRSVSRRRAASAANLDAPPEVNGRPISQHSKHGRASSDFSLLKGFAPPTGDGPHQRSQLSRSPRMEYLHAQYGASSPQPTDIPEDGPPHALSGTRRTPGIRLERGSETFLDVEESDQESHRLSDDVVIMQRNQDYLDEDAPKLAGVTFEELVDRIIAPKMTRADTSFADIFLCLYRNFASPCELMSALLSRLDRLKDDTDMPSLLSIESQMRVIEVVAKWLSLYPGDFARPATRRRLEGLVSDLATSEVFSAAARQMKGNLEQKVVDDDDTWWAKADPVDEDDEEAGRDVGRRLAESVTSLQIDESGAYDRRRPSHSSDLSGADPTAKFTYHSIEDYEREAAALVPSPLLPLNKIRYHSFMDIDPDIVADEITRIDWIMFSSIRIRDMVRHVSLPADQKEKCRSLKNVNRMVAHFNHIAQWVSNMILIRDKAKHRAPCLERFMVIAQGLRTRNNYNGLAAVLAGINGTAIHRLAQTRNLVSQDVQKRFARLVLLMGTQKSHFAYRLAWENTPLPRIPFIPLHRRDLVSAEEGSRTFVGPNNDRINWKKYEVLGEVLLPIMRSQGQPYPNLTKHELSRELILDVKMPTDEEDIYQRSITVEPSTGGESTTKKKFAWLVNKS